jgi:hypothetical protein
MVEIWLDSLDVSLQREIRGRRVATSVCACRRRVHNGTLCLMFIG